MRRQLVLAFSAVAVLASCAPPPPHPAVIEHYDVLIRNGVVYDGSGAPPRRVELNAFCWRADHFPGRKTWLRWRNLKRSSGGQRPCHDDAPVFLKPVGPEHHSKLRRVEMLERHARRTYFFSCFARPLIRPELPRRKVCPFLERAQFFPGELLVDAAA